MDSKILILVLSLTLLMGLVSASDFPDGTGISYFQNKQFLNDSLTIRNFAVLVYNPSPIDTITSGKALETYVSYHSNVKEWNIDNPTAYVTNCTLAIVKYTNSIGTIVTNQTLDSVNAQEKFFIKMNPLDSVQVMGDCIYANATARNNSETFIPLEYSIVEPTYECQSCQMYEWQTQTIHLDRANILQSYTTKNIGHITEVFKQGYDLTIMGFWIFLILLVILAFELIFVGFVWTYNWLRRVGT